MMLQHATAGSFLGISGVAWFWILTIVGVGAVVLSLSRRFQLLRAGRPDNRFDRLGERFKHMLVYAFGQKKMFDDPVAGFYHLLIFYGFLVVSLRTVTMVIEGLFAGWELPLLHSPIGQAYLFSKDIFELLVLVGLCVAVWRRGIQKKERVIQSWGAWLVIGMIAILMATDLSSEGARIAAGDLDGTFLPISNLAAGAFAGLGPAILQLIYGVSWWIHLVTLFVFANELPYSKHFHVYTSIFNSFFANLDSPGKLPSMDLEEIDEDTTFGISTITDFTWKQMLDMYTCTECGRCREFCPTTLTHKPLQPVLFLKSVRDQLYNEQSAILGSPGDSGNASENGLVPAVVDPEVIWACTTCRWCERACPLDITYVDKLVEMRRNLVLEKAEFPEEAQAAFRGYEVNGNPWQLPILKAAGIKIAILGPEELSTGDAPRRLGNEYLFQMLAQQNVETMNGYGVKRIVTNCPHAYNTLAHEYPEFGGDYEVVHGTQLVAELVRAGKVKLTGSLSLDLAYHDPCYLGRTNGEYDAPRFLLNAIPGVRVREAELHRETSMCCGAGGGRMWLEEKIGERINQTRFFQLEASGTTDVAVACPYCFSMLSDAQNELGHEDASAYDVIELVARSLEG
ncbi:MAG: (Fe-S)-binding protein [Acidobacteria bacterium]|nr:(Fe-S)-binding protein [Candidatus Sulfomarinibacter kjeldsenii]